MKTRERILQQALRRFNEDGLAQVSINRIATELEISPGNLYYHFRSKLSIVERLLRRFEDQLAPIVASPGSVAAIDDLWLALHLLFERIDEYRFIYRDVDYLSTEFPPLAPQVVRLTEALVGNVRRMFADLAAAAVLQAGDDEIDMLALHVVLTVTCWSSFARRVPAALGGRTDAASAAYHVLTLLAPYLDEPSRHYLAYLRHKYLK